MNTRTSDTFAVKANNLEAQNIACPNDARFAAGQAIGLEMVSRFRQLTETAVKNITMEKVFGDWKPGQ